MPREYYTRLNLPEVRLDRHYLSRPPSPDGAEPMEVFDSVLDQLENYYDHGKISRDTARRRRVFLRKTMTRHVTVMMRTVELPDTD